MSIENISKNKAYEAAEVGVAAEKAPELFPVIYTEKVIYGDNTPELTEDSIVHYFQRIAGGEKQHRFKLVRVIGGLHYVFCLWQSFGNSWGLLFETQEYEYAGTKLNKDEQAELGKTVSKFLESIVAEDINIESVNISPADAAYSADEIRACTEAIFASPRNTLNREELSMGYRGYEIFVLYRKLFGKDFPTRHHNKRSRAKGRSRFFQNMVRDYLPGWGIDDQYGGYDFCLRRKVPSSFGTPNHDNG